MGGEADELDFHEEDGEKKAGRWGKKDLSLSGS